MTPSLFNEIEEYIDKIEREWTDPLPLPIVEEYEGFQVVREDLINGGSKVRSGDYFVKSLENIDELVYGSCPATGKAQVALAVLAKKYNKKAIIFMLKGVLNPNLYSS